MAKKVMSEKDVKSLLKIDDWSLITKEKIMDFVSLIPNMDKDTALAAIEHFPNYVTMTSNVVDALIQLCDKSLSEMSNGTNQCIEAYKLVLESLNEELKDENLSIKDKKLINEQMISIANSMAAINSEHNKLIQNIVNNGQKLLMTILVVGVTIFGIGKVNNNK